MTPRRWLFVADRLHWPRQSGTDVHGTQLMRALSRRGHAVTLGLFAGAPAEATAGLGLAGVVGLEQLSSRSSGSGRSPGTSVPGSSNPQGRSSLGFCGFTPLQRRVARYWGADPARAAAVADAAQATRADAVVALGADGYTLLAGVRGARRVWYAADEAGLFHWSRLDWRRPATWGNLKTGAVHAVAEWAYRDVVDSVWVVSGADRAAMRLAMSGCRVDLLPNGVDAEWFAPPAEPVPEIPRSAVFWGRLDFGPNEDALRWFLTEVWPGIGAGATFDAFGFRPTPAVEALCRRPGVTLTPDLPDLRHEILRRSVVVLPFVSGRGVKNKLLEAAALARPILGTPRIRNGLEGTPPVVTAGTAAGLLAELERLWGDAAERHRLGQAARAWVVRRHSWDRAAALAERAV